MLIREMNTSDIESVRLIAADTWRNTYSSFIPAEIQEKILTEAYSSEIMEHRFKSSITLVAEYDGKIAGYAFLSGNRLSEDVYLESLYVHPHHQGKGVGKQLILAGLSMFNEPHTVTLTVYKGNSNITFYEKQGFKVLKEKEGDFKGHPVTFILMRKELTNFE